MANIRITQLELYNAFIRRKKQVFAISVIATIVIALFAISAGSLNIPISEIIKTIMGKGESQSQAVIMGIRLPRVTAAILVGAALAVSGAVMQCVLQNPLASASTLGVSQGAAFGAALGIIFLAAVGNPPPLPQRLQLIIHIVTCALLYAARCLPS